MDKFRLLLILVITVSIAFMASGCGDDCECDGTTISCQCGDMQGCECTGLDSCDCVGASSNAYFRLNTYYRHISYFATTYIVKVSTNVKWSVSSNSYLVEMTPSLPLVEGSETSYEGSGEVTLKFPQNDTDKARDFIITFTYFTDGDSFEGRETVAVTFTQDANPN